MKIYLKKDWAKFIDFDNQDSIFVGRDKELQHLKSYVINNDTGSILVSGIRGVGKTSFVYKLIQELMEYYKKTSNPKLIPILINASQLNLKEDSIHDDLIKNLIRRFYAELKDEENISQLGDLYKKIQGEYYKSEEIFKRDETIEENLKNKKFNISLKKEIDKLSLFNFIKLALVVIGVSLITLNTSILWKIIGIILLVIPTMSLSYVYDKVDSFIIKNTYKKSAKEFYKEDNSIGNLEFDLKEFLKEKKEDYKFLFIIDELDKLDSKIDPFKIIEFYKNLFTLSNANYIFITDQKAYEKLLVSTKEEHTTPTLFTYKTFLTEPYYGDLIKYFNLIIESISINNKKFQITKLSKNEREDLDLVINYFLYVSKTNYFNLKNKINDFSYFDEDYNPYLDVNKIFDENNKEDIRLKSALLKIVKQVYETHIYKTLDNLHLNQKNLNILFNVISEHIGNKFKYDTVNKNLEIMTMSGEKVESLDDSESNHIINFLDLATRYGILRFSGDENTRNYEWTTIIPDKIYDSSRMLFKDEEDFIKQFKLLISTVNDIDDLLENRDFNDYKGIYDKHDATNIIGKPTFPTYNKFLPYYKKLREPIPSHIPIENLKAYTEELTIFTNEIFTNVVDISSRILQNLLNTNPEINYSIVKSNYPQVLTSLQVLRDNLGGVNHNIIHSPDFSKQIVIVQNHDISSLDGSVLKALDEQSKTIYFLNLITEEGKNSRKSINYQYETQIGEDRDGNPKMKTEKKKLQHNFLEIKFNESFRVFKDKFSEIKKWLK